jgi:hypothetical protein
MVKNENRVIDNGRREETQTEHARGASRAHFVCVRKGSEERYTGVLAEAWDGRTRKGAMVVYGNRMWKTGDPGHCTVFEVLQQVAGVCHFTPLARRILNGVAAEGCEFRRGVVDGVMCWGWFGKIDNGQLTMDNEESKKLTMDN